MAGIYIHIPFCKQACYYCDFHFSTSLQRKDDLLEALRKEISIQKSFLDNETIHTIYFGGGTPSLLKSEEINSLIDTITQYHTVAADAEITIEANPDDLDPAKIKGLKQTAVNRFSIGVQSFFDEDLFWMNRAHRGQEAGAAVKRVQDAGFENITADLIYGYPLLDDRKWQHNIGQIFDLNIPHLSAYSMTVEPKTALATYIKKKVYPPLNENQSAGQFIYLTEQMEQRGFEHYEISNFCLPGQYSKHNSNYWAGVKYMGIGPSAHSYNSTSRQWNVANNNLYIDALEKNNIPFEREELTEENRLNEYIMTSLRTMWGLDLDKLDSISKGASATISKMTMQNIERGWLIKKEKTYILTKTGKLYADKVASDLFF